MLALRFSPTVAHTQPSSTSVKVAASAQGGASAPAVPLARRAALAGVAAVAAAAFLPIWPAPAAAAAEGGAAIKVVRDELGSGTAEARTGDLVLLHYVGRTAAGELFDSSLGGTYRDGGTGKLRPVLLALGGSPVPGICAGLQQGVEGMRVGGKRTFSVPPSLGFGSDTVLAPYGVVPGGSELRYEVQLLRLSRRGPDALLTGVSQCGGGFVMERTTGCADIQPAEYL